MEVLGYMERGVVWRIKGLDEIMPMSEVPGEAFFFWGLVVVQCASDWARKTLLTACVVVENIDQDTFIVRLPETDVVRYPVVVERGNLGAIASQAECVPPPKGDWFYFRIGKELHTRLDALRERLGEVASMHVVLGLVPLQVAVFMSPAERDAYLKKQSWP